MGAAFDHLGVFAEVSAAIVGFVAIFLVLVRREEKFPPEDAIRIRALILVGFIGIFMSLLPIALSKATISVVSVWIISSLAQLAMVGSVSAYIAIKHFQLSDAARDNIPLGNLLLAWTCAAIAGVLLVSIVLRTPVLGYAFSYTAALILVLGVGATNFYTIAIQKLL